MILGLPIEDTQCGAKVFKREIIPLAYENKFLTRWLFDVEIFLRMKKDIMNRMYEQPLDKWVHMDDSKLGFKDALQIPIKLINIWYSYSLTSQFAESSTEFSLAFNEDSIVYNEENVWNTTGMAA